MRLRVKKIIGC